MNKISRAPGAHSTFLACGNPDVLRPEKYHPVHFASQYYEVSALFAAHDYTSATVTANVKLVTGGAEDVTCAAHALLYAISDGTENAGLTRYADRGSLEGAHALGARNALTAVDELGVRVTTYPCQ